jgi:hypothetical protein
MRVILSQSQSNTNGNLDKILTRYKHKSLILKGFYRDWGDRSEVSNFLRKDVDVIIAFKDSL